MVKGQRVLIKEDVIPSLIKQDVLPRGFSPRNVGSLDIHPNNANFEWVYVCGVIRLAVNESEILPVNIRDINVE